MVSVENTLDLAVFGDILVWVATFLGLVPWDTLLGRKKDFHEQLAVFGDEPFVCNGDDSFGCGFGPSARGRDQGSEVHPGEFRTEPIERGSTTERVRPYVRPVRKRL